MVTNALVWLLAACAILGYLLGNVQFAVIISRLKYKDDVRKYGSGNAGSTNMLRVFGLRIGLLTFAGDLLKGVLSVLIGRLIGGEVGGYVCAFFAVLGHNFPVFLRFKGGKGVATSLGIVWMVHPLIGLLITLLAAVVIPVFKTISIASLSSATLMFLLTLVLDWGNWPLIMLAFLLWALIVLRHEENIRRLLRNQEPKMSFGKKDPAARPRVK